MGPQPWPRPPHIQELLTGSDPGSSHFFIVKSKSPTPPSTRTLTPEEIARRADVKIPPLLLPKPGSVFADRALRLRQVAAGHAMRDYLMLLAVVAEAQHELLQHHPQVALPDAVQIEAARSSNKPLLATDQWPRDSAWREQLHLLLAQVLDKLPEDSPARAGVQAALDMPEDTLEQQAERLLAGITLGLDMAAAPLIAAGLQLYWTHLAAATAVKDPGAWHMPFEPNRCPCCGSLPAASITRIRGKLEGQRYLVCSLCSAQWHFMRIKCTHCNSLEGIHFRSLQPKEQEELGDKRAIIEAETCDKCQHYLKTMHMDLDPQLEPMADDLASLTLDLLVSDAGYVRYGNNLLLLFGDSQPQLEEA